MITILKYFIFAIFLAFLDNSFENFVRARKSLDTKEETKSLIKMIFIIVLIGIYLLITKIVFKA